MMLRFLAVLLLVTACAGEKMDIVVIETNKGSIEVELFTEQAPETVANFLQYVDAGHYSNTIFHRVISGFMVQGGGFTPEGQQKPTQPPVRLEAGISNDIGTIAMARTPNPDSATSQFFINVADNGFLNPAAGNPGYAVFGKVVSGMEVVKEIEGVATSNKFGAADWPVEDVVILSISRK